MQPEGSEPEKAEQGAEQHDQAERELPFDPGHVRTLAHYTAMLRELQGQK